MTRRTILAIAAATVLVTVACKNPDDEPAGSDRNSDASEQTASDRSTGVTDDTIEVGIPYIDLSAVEDILHLSHGDYEAAFTAIIDDINADGGINGRTIEPTFAPVPPSQLDPDGARHACLQLTEDAEVFAVIGYVDGDGALCYVEDHDTPLVGGYLTAERRSRATAPWFTVVPDQDRLIRDGAAALAEELDGSVVAVVGLPAEAATLSEVAVPALEDAGLDVADTAVFDASGSDVEAARSQAATIAERFDTLGVDTIVTLGGSDVIMADGLARTGHRPRLVAFTTNGFNGLITSGSVDPTILEDALAITEWPPARTEDPVYRRCIDVVEAATGTTVEDPDTKPLDGRDHYVSVQVACQHTLLFRAIAQAAGPTLTNATFLAAGRDLGPVALPGMPDATYTPERPDGTLPLYVARYDAASNRMLSDERPAA